MNDCSGRHQRREATARPQTLGVIARTKSDRVVENHGSRWIPRTAVSCVGAPKSVRGILMAGDSLSGAETWYSNLLVLELERYISWEMMDAISSQETSLFRR